MESERNPKTSSADLEALVVQLRQQIRRVRAMADRVHSQLTAENVGDEEAGWRLAA